MQFNDTSTRLGIIQNCERYTNLGDTSISGTTSLLQDFTAYCNIISSRVWHTIFTSNGNWAYDDSNQTDLPQATTDIVSGTSKYALPASSLTLEKLEMQDSNDQWFPLEAITLEEIHNKGEFMDDNGTPRYYRLVGKTLELFPTPNYASTAGLKAFFDRGSVAFASDDTTQTPGFASEYHDIVPIGASIEWLKIKTPSDPILQNLQQDYLLRLQQIKQFYSLRFKDKKPRVGRLYNSFK